MSGSRPAATTSLRCIRNGTLPFYGVADEATAADAVAQDPDASADVFMYANDNITTMTDAGALAMADSPVVLSPAK